MSELAILYFRTLPSCKPGEQVKQFAVLGKAEIRVSPQKKLTLSHPATTHLVFSV